MIKNDAEKCEAKGHECIPGGSASESHKGAGAEGTTHMPPPTDLKLIEAFTLMWGMYPGPASLVHKNRTIIAVNRACLAGGRKPGMTCAQWDSPERHRGCLANRALQERMALHREVRDDDGILRTYWLPIPDYPDYYVHFTTETMKMHPARRDTVA